MKHMSGVTPSEGGKADDSIQALTLMTSFAMLILMLSDKKK